SAGPAAGGNTQSSSPLMKSTGIGSLPSSEGGCTRSSRMRARTASLNAAGAMDAALVEIGEQRRRAADPFVHFGTLELTGIDRAGGACQHQRAHLAGRAQRVVETGPAAHRLRDERDVLQFQAVD